MPVISLGPGPKPPLMVSDLAQNIWLQDIPNITTVVKSFPSRLRQLH